MGFFSGTGFNLELYDDLVDGEHKYLLDNGWTKEDKGRWSHIGKKHVAASMRAYHSCTHGHAVNAQKEFDRRCVSWMEGSKKRAEAASSMKESVHPQHDPKCHLLTYGAGPGVCDCEARFPEGELCKKRLDADAAVPYDSPDRCGKPKGHKGAC